VLYTQFDADSFYKLHTSNEGYFEYQKDGFGPVVTNYEDTMSAITVFIEKHCKMEDRYAKRVDKFFAYNDAKNSERVLAAIIEADNRSIN
jgi:CDP-glycerol glycerophosphotransferase (TagB/SpsB family)